MKGREALGDRDAVISVTMNNKHWRLPILQQFGARRVVPLKAIRVAPHERRSTPFVGQSSKCVGLEKERRNMEDAIVTDKSLEL